MGLCWRRFRSKLQQYVDEFGTARVAARYVSPCGYTLGCRLAQVRSKRMYLAGREFEAERTAWLEQIPGWCWHGLDHPEYRAELSNRMTARLSESNLAAESWRNATPKERDDRNKQRDATMSTAREQKRSSMSKSDWKKHIQKTKTAKTYTASRQRDMQALRGTLVPDARWPDLAKYRKDGTVQKALKLFLASR